MDRRHFLSLAATTGLLTQSSAQAAPEPVATKARIVIIGAGAAGTGLANRLVRRLRGAQITIVDPSLKHVYQPGLTLVATGLKPASYTLSERAHWLPEGITWVQEAVAGVDALSREVHTAKGLKLPYDFLVVASGLVLDHAGIEGFSLDMVGKNGIGALYAGPEYAARTWQAAERFAQEGGHGVFTRPGTEMKCAGAPLKHAFLIEDIARRRGARSKARFTYAAQNNTLFGVPIVSEKVRMIFSERKIDPLYSHVLKAIEPGKKRAHFSTPEGAVEVEYDYIHVIPPQRAPDFVRESGLGWQDKWRGQDWLEVDKHTLRHARFPEVFGLGDVAGVPKGKTAASAKWQIPVVEDHLIASITGKAAQARYDGYTSCPMITRIGRAMLVEFDYNNNLTPSFPGIIAPLQELWISWLMEDLALKPTYNAMLRGDA